MRNSSTFNYLVKKLYNETEPTEDQAIEDAFALNYSLKEKYNALMASKKMLDELKPDSSELQQKSIDRILEFSKMTSISNNRN